MILASMINCFTGLELKRAADVVRERWDDWLLLLTKVERFPPPDHAEQFVCVAWTSLDRTIPPRIVMGDTTEIAEALRGETVAPTFISMALVLHCLRGNAANAGIALPEKLKRRRTPRRGPRSRSESDLAAAPKTLALR